MVMGHANIRTSGDLYAHLDTSDVLIDIERMTRLPGPPPPFP
jgi:hypothetical protein